MILKFYSTIITILLIITGIFTSDRLTWAMEIAPIIIAGILLVISYQKFKFTQLSYVLIFIHSIILIYGGMYTYANTPLGNILQELLSFDRNPYDRIGHFAQGFIPAIIFRELLLRKTGVKQSGFVNAIIILTCMGISAGYELIEWLTAIILGEGADEFLGMQGDVWDTQWDMGLATVGAIFALFTLSKLHNNQLTKHLQ